MSRREDALAALFAAIQGQAPGGVACYRADGNAITIPSSGAVLTQHDGSTDGSPILSPLSYDITHSVPVTIESKARLDIDAALVGVGAAIGADATLGGVVDWAELAAVDVDAESPSQNGQPQPRFLSAQLTVTLYYTAPTAAG